MYYIASMTDKIQIHPTVDKKHIEAINVIVDTEKRTFSQAVNILLGEAIVARNEAKNGYLLKPTD